MIHFLQYVSPNMVVDKLRIFKPNNSSYILLRWFKWLWLYILYSIYITCTQKEYQLWQPKWNLVEFKSRPFTGIISTTKMWTKNVSK